MKLKKWKIISVFGIFLLSSLFHFVYDFFPNFVTSLFFPVNESIWEHNKIIIASFFIWSIIEKIKYKDKNTYFSGLISALLCCFLVMIIFTPIYLYILKTQDNIILTLIIFFISICISEYFSYKLLEKEYNPKLDKISLYLWIIPFLVNAILTYYPLDFKIFYDFNKNKFGI